MKIKRNFGSSFVLILCLTSKALSGPILVSFIILSDPRKEKQKILPPSQQFEKRKKKQVWKKKAKGAKNRE